MLPFLSCTHICHPHTPLQGESPSEEKSSMRSPLLVSAPVLEHGKQQPLVDESPTEESYEPPLVEELRVYSRRQKSKVIPDPSCRTSDLDSGNSTSTPDLNTFTVKHKAAGSVERYKTRLVAK